MSITATTDSAVPPLWSTLPGWGIAANLMPADVLAARRLHAIRRRCIGLLAAVVVLFGLGYGYAFLQSHAAGSTLAAQRAETTRLQASQTKFADVTKMQDSIAAVKQQLSTLVADDVGYAELLEQLRAALPATMTISKLEATTDTGTSGTALASGSSGAATLDSSGRKHIGTITISGNGQALSDASDYLEQLGKVRGVVEPYPLVNKLQPPGTEYTLHLTLTDELFTHKYDAAKNGGN